MSRRLLRLLFPVLCSALVLGLCTTTAEARGKRSARVYGIARVGQDWYNAKLKVRWRAVRGASYQMRWADAPARLSHSRVVATRTSGGTYTTAGLDRARTWYVQVRAIKAGKLGPWSAARGLRFQNMWPGIPTLSGSGRAGAVDFSWPYTPYTSRYRVRWSAAWYGNWPGEPNYVDRTTGGWVSQYARTSTYAVPSSPAPGDNMLAVDYANPVFAQIEASNAYNVGAIRRSQWVAAFPTPPTPADGDRLRMGNYNVMLFPSTGPRLTAIRRNISAHSLDVVALEEANAPTAAALVSALGSPWKAVPSVSGSGQQILYRGDKFKVLANGSFTVPNPKSPSNPLVTPWARLSPLKPVSYAASQNFYVVAVHFSEDSSKPRLEQNRDAGLAAKAAMAAIDEVNYGEEPVIVAGDLRYGREPYGDPAGYTAAQPTFVRGGYYDAMASMSRSGHQYSVVNIENGSPSAKQTIHPSGLGPRSDHILMKGVRGSFRYANVVNWSDAGVVPSDHNLIYADIAIPLLP